VPLLSNLQGQEYAMQTEQMEACNSAGLCRRNTGEDTAPKATS